MSGSRLGKGLDELLPDSPESGEGELRSIPIDEIKPNPEQPRESFDRDQLDELTQSIRNQGVVEPILVRPVEENEFNFMIIAGERRWRAAQEANLERIPGIIKDLPPEKAYVLSLVENIQRENLNPLEEARAYKRLMDEENLNQEQVAETVGKSRSSVANRVRLLELIEPVKDALDDGRISAGHARALLGVDDRDIAIKILKEIESKSLNVRQTEKRVKEIQPDEQPTEEDKEKPKPKKETDSSLARLAAEFEDKLGAPVQIDSEDRKSGRIIIQFNDPDDFERIRSILNQ